MGLVVEVGVEEAGSWAWYRPSSRSLGFGLWQFPSYHKYNNVISSGKLYQYGNTLSQNICFPTASYPNGNLTEKRLSFLRQTLSDFYGICKPSSEGFSHMLIGYMRVSTPDKQSTDLQRDALVNAGVDPRHLLEDQPLEQEMIVQD